MILKESVAVFLSQGWPATPSAKPRFGKPAQKIYPTGMTLQSQAIKDQARALGFDKVGIVPAAALTEEGERLRQWLAHTFHGQMGYMARDPGQRSDPRLLLPSTRSVISVALNYYRPERHSDSPETGKISRYAWG